MSWVGKYTEQLRFLIGDFTAPYTYQDAQLIKFLAIGATITLRDLAEYQTQIGGSYTINSSGEGDAVIIPDPSESFGVLLTLRAATLIASSELKKAGAVGGYKIIDDNSTIDTTQVVVSAQNTFKIFDQMYKDALSSFKSGNQLLGLAVFGPYASANYSRWPYGPIYPSQGLYRC